jgi:hypothetical protein
MNKPNIKQRLRRTFFALTIVGALSALPSAKADPPVTAIGNGTRCDNLISVQFDGPNIIVEVSVTITFTGTFNGTYVGTELIRISGPAGAGTGLGSGVFTGTVNGSQPGTMVLSFTGEDIGPVFGGLHVVLDRWVVGQGTGGLAGLNGQGTIPSVEETGPTEDCEATFAFEYSGQIQFAP